MSQTATQASALADRLCRPQRIGVFGHRGVGKTTFLTMLYREAVGGRVPELRLAAADALTADYLADKILQLEAGQPLPATLAETDLRFHLYHQNRRLDLLLKDYQGEHVAVGREEPIREFLRDCDAVWLCLDVTVATASDTCLHAQQEVEQLVEDYLAAQPTATPHRPMALVLTKADLLPNADDTAVNTLVQDQLGMTLHALLLHCPQRAILAVSSLGKPIQAEDGTAPVFQPRPIGLAGPLLWLAHSLQEQDEARLEQLWQGQPNNLTLLQRCVACFGRRYPDTAAARKYTVRLRQLRRKQLRRRLLAGGSALLAMVLALWGYDAWGQHQVRRFAEVSADDPSALLQQWQAFQRWHPTRRLFLATGSHAESERLRELQQQVREKRCEEQLAQMRRQAADPDASPEAAWEEFQKFREEFPERNIDEAVQEFRTTLKARRDAERERKALAAHEELVRKEAQTELPAQIARAETFLADYGDTENGSDVRLRLAGYLRRVEEQTIEAARLYSTRQPFNFLTRQENYIKYLQRYPQGVFADEARKALDAIALEWDKHDFRKVRDHFQDKPGEVKELIVLCRAYLAGQPLGRYRDSATSLLRWSERVRGESDYKVTLKSGSFDPKSAGYLSRGLYLSVELEVNGVAYGPSTIVKRSAEPEWNYEFPRSIRWKLGDQVRIRVTDHYYWRRTIMDVRSEDGDLLGMKMLSGSVDSGKHSVVFESDFGMPVLPKLE
jgi:GTPase SAR1 family protein